MLFVSKKIFIKLLFFVFIFANWIAIEHVQGVSEHQFYAAEIFDHLQPYAHFIGMEDRLAYLKTVILPDQKGPSLSLPLGMLFKTKNVFEGKENEKSLIVETKSDLVFTIDSQDPLVIGLYMLHFAVDRSFIEFVQLRAIKRIKSCIIKNRPKIIAAVNKITGQYSEIEYERFLVFLDDCVFEQEFLTDLHYKDVTKIAVY
ncbi:MAG: hypothetical protein EBZ47_10225, partial [Chlamydiae bacterium]|nr:hypothetical protein [Chlamydiota bacterium]